MTTHESAIESVVEGLSQLIASELRAFSSEYWSPRLGVDQSESEMKFRKQRIVELRVMRTQFEDIMFGLERGTV